MVDKQKVERILLEKELFMFNIERKIGTKLWLIYCRETSQLCGILPTDILFTIFIKYVNNKKK